MAAGGAALALLLTLTGCGGSAAPEPTGTEPTAAAPVPADAPTSADPAAFCEAVVDLDVASAGPPPVDFETATPEEIQTALAEVSGMLEPLVVAVEEVTPEDVADEVDTLAAAVRSDDPAAFDSPEVAEAEATVDGWMIDNCGYEQITVTATDHEFQGLPDTLTPGVRAVTFTNEGEEIHVAGVLRINDDVTESFEELLALPEEQAMQMAESAGGAFAPPGGSNTSFVRFETGRYGVFCPLPEGSIPPAEGTGPPHFVLGMLHELTVE